MKTIPVGFTFHSDIASKLTKRKHTPLIFYLKLGGGGDVIV